jgi:hypothetical protein
LAWKTILNKKYISNLRMETNPISLAAGSSRDASAAYAVAIGLTSADIDQLGGTGNVDVFCPPTEHRLMVEV